MSWFRKPTRERGFWDWFCTNADRLFDYERNQEATFDEIAQRLAAVHSDITFEIGPVRDGIRDFIVSADGLVTLFPQVVKLVQDSPTVPKWNVLAFRQRKGVAYKIEYEGITIDPADVWFLLKTENRKLDLELFLKGFATIGRSVQSAMYILLDAALGEYDVETKIGAIKIFPLANAADSLDLIPFKDLPATVDGQF